MVRCNALCGGNALVLDCLSKNLGDPKGVEEYYGVILATPRHNDRAYVDTTTHYHSTPDHESATDC
ncbi:MAG: hypothetical protein WBL68_03400 [Nitrososphaeraceae archaeon]